MRLPRPLVRPALALVPILGLSLATVPAVGLATATPAAAAGCPASGGAKLPRPSAIGDVVFHGGGWGHGLGMSQYGAQGAARLGCSATQILTRYYAGTRVASRGMPSSVRLRMLEAGSKADLAARTGPVTWELDGCTDACPPEQPQGARWQLKVEGGSYTLRALGTPATPVVWQGGAAGQELRARYSGTVVDLETYKGSSTYLRRSLRWDLTRFSISGTSLNAVQEIRSDAAGNAMDKYLWGIAEVPASFPAAALRAQAIAARTYAAKRAGRVLMPTPADQNYTGYAKESEGANGVWGAKWRAAVDATSGKVVVSRSTGSMIDTFYSSSTGGYTEDERYVWGVEAPFLRAVDDSRWDLASSNPPSRRAWAVGFSWATLAKKLRFDRISAISVPKRGSASRVSGVKISGVRSGAPVTTYLTGWDVRQALGLLSPGFEISVTTIGGSAATPLVGDWNGDGTDDPGWFRRGTIALRISDATGTWVKRYRFGKKGDVPVVGDWDGDGVDSVGVFRKGQWILTNRQAGGAADLAFRYGAAGDRPVVGTWKAGSLGIGVVRKGRWLLRTTTTAGPTEVTFRYGRTADVPVVGDWDGDGLTSVGVHRDNQFLLRDKASGGAADHVYRFGKKGDRAVAGDWNGDGAESTGAVRARRFHLRNQLSGGRASLDTYFAG